MQWWVEYDIMGTTHRQGPYDDHPEATKHQKDIAGYEGVENCTITNIPLDEGDDAFDRARAVV